MCLVVALALALGSSPVVSEDDCRHEYYEDYYGDEGEGCHWDLLVELRENESIVCVDSEEHAHHEVTRVPRNRQHMFKIANHANC